MIRLIFLAVILSLIAIFSYFNYEEKILVAIFFGNVSKETSIATLAIAAFVAGTLLSAFITAPSLIRALLKQRGQRRRIGQLEEELDQIRAAARDRVHPPPLFRDRPDDVSNDV